MNSRKKIPANELQGQTQKAMNKANINTASAKVTDFCFIFPVTEKDAAGRYYHVCDLHVSGGFTKDLAIIESVTNRDAEVLGELPREIMIEISRAAINHCVGLLHYKNANQC